MNMLEALIASKMSGGSGSGGGDKVLNADGIIKQEYLPEGYPYAGEGYVLPEETLMPSDDGMFGSQTAISLVSGETYIVNWNGSDYNCVASDYTEGEVKVGGVLGNLGALTGGEDTGEPFVLLIVSPDMSAAMGGATIVAMPLDGSTTVTVSIKGKTIEPINPKFLPEGYPYKEKARTILNESTAEPDENGSFSFRIDHQIVAGRKYIVTENGETNTYTASPYGSVGVIVGGWVQIDGSGGVFNDSLTNLQSVTLSIVEAEDTVTPMWSGYLPFAVAFLTQDLSTREVSCTNMSYEDAAKIMLSGTPLIAILTIGAEGAYGGTWWFTQVEHYAENQYISLIGEFVNKTGRYKWSADGIVENT